jgi:signal transduction histidine kinase
VREPLADQNLSTTFFRIFQETLTNVIRHAGATQVAVELKEADGRITLEVRDNGRGIAREEIFNSNSMGLLGMRERTELLGGAFQIGSLPGGKGTRVRVSIPLTRRSRPLNVNHENTARRRSHRSAARLETNSGR